MNTARPLDAGTRRVVVRLGDAEAALAGGAAELVALVAATAPSDLTLRLATALVARDRRLRGLVYGSVELHVNNAVVRVDLHERLLRDAGAQEVPA